MDPDFETPQASMHDRAAIDFALTAIRGLLMINGGAIVALLAFLSNVWTNNASGARELAINLKIPLGFFFGWRFRQRFNGHAVVSRSTGDQRVLVSHNLGAELDCTPTRWIGINCSYCQSHNVRHRLLVGGGRLYR